MQAQPSYNTAPSSAHAHAACKKYAELPCCTPTCKRQLRSSVSDPTMGLTSGPNARQTGAACKAPNASAACNAKSGNERTSVSRNTTSSEERLQAKQRHASAVASVAERRGRRVCRAYACTLCAPAPDGGVIGLRLRKNAPQELCVVHHVSVAPLPQRSKLLPSVRQRHLEMRTQVAKLQSESVSDKQR